VAETYAGLGYKQVKIMNGGVEAWQNAGYPLL
jgi:3-mercaptopyruvate sulfurtransferase SseA